MNRLVLAIVILIALLLGLRVINTPGFRQWISNQMGGAPPTQTTGFNTTVPTDIDQSTPTVPALPQPSPPSPGNSGTGQDGTPAQPLRPIPGGW